MVVRVLDLCHLADTNAQGDILYNAVKSCVEDHKNVVVDFSGVGYATSSFANSFLGPLVESYGVTRVKQRVKIINVSRTVKYVLKKSMQPFENLAA